MQDTALLPILNENGARNSQVLEPDYEIRSEPTISTTEQQRVLSRLPSLRPDPAISPRITHRRQKPYSLEPPVSNRESWWRATIKDTPNPGRYNTHLNTFIKEIVSRPMTYGFKSDGRRRDPQPLEPKGKDLLPGAYTVDDFLEKMHRLQLSYGFKGRERQDLLKNSMLTNQDKDIDVAPGLYETQKYGTINAPVEAVGHSVFKSKIRRKVFLPKVGPAPGDYEPQTNVISVNNPTITSSFRSRTNRFQKKSSNVRGRRTYDKLTAFPTSTQIDTVSTSGTVLDANFAHTASTSV